MTGRLIRCLLLCLMLGITAYVATPAYHVHAQSMHVTASVQEAAGSADTLPTVTVHNGGPAATMAAYMLVIGLLLTIVAVIGLQACRRTTAKFRYSFHRYQAQL